jgi:hypothetical protein
MKMRWRTQTFLGLAFEPGGLLAAEVEVRGGEASLTAVGEFRYPDGTGLDEAAKLGEALREFLNAHDCGAKHAVVGLPARWLVAKQKRVPPVGGAHLAAMLRLQGEKEFSVPADEIALDYTVAGPTGRSREVLLVAAQKAKVEQATALARGAGLKVEAVVPSVLPLAVGGDGSQPERRCTLYVRPAGTEIIVLEEGQIQILKHLSLSSPEPGDAEQLVRQVRQSLALLPSGGEGTRLTVCDAAGLGPEAGQRFADSVGFPVEWREDVRAIDREAGGAGSPEHPALYAAPALLALSAAWEERRPVDFMHSKLAVRESRMPGRRVLWAGAITAAILLITGLLVEGWQADRREVARLRSRLKAMEREIERAQRLLRKVSEAGEWFGGNRKYLDGLRELTLSFPEEGSVWATSVVVQKDMRSIVSGKSADERSVLGVLDQMKENERFAGPKLLHMRQMRSGAGEVSFAISFDFVDVE